MEQDFGREVAKYLVDNNSYASDNALRVAREVIEAMRELRKNVVAKYINKRVLIQVDELQVEVFVLDAKVTYEGISYQVKPVAGEKTIWVKKFIKII